MHGDVPRVCASAAGSLMMQATSRVGSSGFVLALSALALGFVNALVRPVLTVLTLPITVLTLGLFLLVVNGIAFGLAAFLVPGFRVAGLGPAILGSLVVAGVSWIIGWLTRRASLDV